MEKTDRKRCDIDFKAQLNIDGRFKCYLSSDGVRVVIMMGESVGSPEKDETTRMLYKYHQCQLEDRESLKEFFESEVLAENPSLLRGEYGELFNRLIDKVARYGTKKRDINTFDGEINGHSENDKVYHLSNYRKSMPSWKGQRSFHIN